MAINAELQSRRNSTRQKVKQQNPTPVIEETSDSGRDRTQLVRATRDLGGNPSPAFVSNSSIPTLERNVVNTYEQNAPKPTLSRIAGAMMGAVLQKPNAQSMQAARTNNNNYAAAQRNNQLYNDLKTEDVDRILNSLGQTDIARKPNEQFVESIKSNGGSTNPFDYKNFWDFQANSPLGGAALFDVLSAESHKFERQNLTPEMRRAGLTEKDLEIWNNARNEEERQQVLSQWAAEHPIVSTARSFPENIGGSLENVANILGSYATGTPMESKPTRAEIYRNAVSEGIDSGVGRFAYNAATSAGDVILASLLAGPAGAAAPAIGAGTMGIEKASSTANDAIDRGLNPNQIVGEVAGSWLTTTLTELIPFNNIFKGASILKGMASEGGQEIAEDIADTLLDELVTGLGRNHDKSSLSTSYHQYLDAGYTPYDAVVATAKDYGKQLIMDGALGAVTGGAVQGGANLVSGRNVITGNLPTLNQQTETRSENSKAVLDDLAKATEDVVDNPSQEKWDSFVELAEKMAEENPDISDDIGEIYRTVEKFYDDNEANIPDTINENVDTVNENVDIPAVNAVQEEVNTEPISTDTIEQSQPEVKEVRVPRREISAVRRTTEGLTNKLDLFSSETDVDVEPLKVQLDEAYNNVINTSGNAQAEAIQNFNNTVDAINEQMSGAAITQSAREYNEDGYNRMRSVTDGRRIAITDAQKESTGYRTLRELNSAVYSGNPNSTIKFYAEGALNTIPLDNVYNEMRYLSNGELPAVLVGDQLNALVNYITQYKSRKGDTVEVANWDRMKTDSRTKAEQTIDDLADDTLDKLEDGEITAEEMSVVFNQLSELQRDNPRLAGRISQLYEQLASAMMDHVANASIYDDDIAAATEENIDELAEEIIEEVPKRHNDTAGVKTGRFKKSEVFSNTGEKGGMVNDKIRELDKKYGHMMYENNTEAESMAAASEKIAKNGVEAETRRLMEKNRNGQYWDNVDTDEMMMIYHDAMAYAESLDAKGDNSDEAWGYAYDLYEAIKEQGSSKGQALQAYAKWSRSNTPEGLFAEATSIIEKAKRGEDLEKAVARETKGAVNYDKNGKPIRAMDVNFMREFMQEAKKLESLEPNTREFKHVYDNLGKMINTQIPSGMVERVRTLLMDNMLGNARTLITRNAGGNIGFNLVEQLLRKPLSGLIDSAVSKARGTSRTVGDVNLFTKEGRELYKAYGSGAKEALRQEIYDFTHGIHSSRSGEVNLSNAAGNNRTVFKNNKSNQSKGLNYFLNKADNLVRYGLSLGDRWAYEATYSQTLAELQQLYDQGKLTRKFTTKDGRTVTERMTEAQFKKWAEEQAKINALEACYQDDSEMAQGFLAARKLVNKLSRATIGVDVLSQFAIPFAKTPANIIQRAIEYSPLGLAKNAIQTIREVNSDTGLNQRRFSVDTSRNIIGSALFALGILAAKAGTLTGGYSEDKDMREAQKEAGMQEYALNTGDKNISIDWIPVLGNNAVAAAAFYNAIQNNPELSMSQRLGSGLSEGLKTQFESSALQGLNRFISGSNSYSGNNGDLVSNAQDTLMSGLTQFVPSLLRQGAAATDPYRRQLSGANPNDYYRNAILNSIPGLRETLEPRISRTGEIMEQNEGRSAFQKWMDNFINPATVTVVNNENVRDEAMRLYDSTGNNVAFQPSAKISDLKVDDHVPTAEEYTQYQQAAYGNMNQAASELIGSDYYQTLTDGEKESMLADIYSAIKSVEKLNTLDGDKSNLNGAAQAYDEGGVDGLINYMIARNTMAQLGIQNNPTNREQILEVLNQGGTEAVQEMVDRSQELANAGIDSYNLQKKYDHATSYIPSLTPTQFVETWNQIDGMIKPNDSISQDEMLAYLNQSPESYNINQVLEYWNAYGDDWTYQPYWDEKNGVWKKHKP